MMTVGEISFEETLVTCLRRVFQEHVLRTGRLRLPGDDTLEVPHTAPRAMPWKHQRRARFRESGFLLG